MYNFCTLFDSNYITRGLALYRSLSAVCPSFHLYVIAFNDAAYEYLVKAGLKNLTPVSLKDFEDEELLRVKPSRSIVEYCWTCTPSVILYCIEKYDLASCTYIDSDMIFYKDPGVLFDELGNKSIIISEHRYSKQYDQGSTHGIYCVQFTYFKNNEVGMQALRWWRARCLEWCFNRLEHGKFGDQKYLDDWTTRFPGVHVMQHPGGGIAPWNLQQFDFARTGDGIEIKAKKTGQTFQLIFFHFHALKFYTDGKVSCSGALYDISQEVKELVYAPYIKTLIEIEKSVVIQYPALNVSGARTPAPRKLDAFLEFMKGFILMVGRGKLSPFQIRNYFFNRHYHYYRLEQFK